MNEAFMSVLGLLLILGPMGAWATCKKTDEHVGDPPDLLGGALVVLHPLFLGVWVAFHALLKQEFPAWLAGITGSIALIAFEFLLWRRAIRHTHCASKLATMFRRKP